MLLRSPRPLDFRFGPRLAEVDLLCRSRRIAIELDGYFHFLGPDGYRTAVEAMVRRLEAK